MNLRRHLPTAALCGATVMLSVAGGATAAGLITGTDIKDGTVASADLRNKDVRGADLASNAVNGTKVRARSLDGSDVLDDSITGADVDESTLDLPGGTPATTNYSWSAPYTLTPNGGGYSGFTLTSQTPLPARSVVTAQELSVTSDCDHVSLDVSLVGGGQLASANAGAGFENLHWASTGPTAGPLRIGSYDMQGRTCTGTFTLEFAVQDNPPGGAVPFA